MHLGYHWVAPVGWAPSLQLWLAPRGTCQTLEAKEREDVNIRGEVMNTQRKQNRTWTYLHLSHPPRLHLLSIKKEKTTSDLGVDTATSDPLQTTKNQENPTHSMEPEHPQQQHFYHPTLTTCCFITYLTYVY